MEISVLFSDIPFARDAAVAEAERLGVTLYDSDTAKVIDPRACMKIEGFMERRTAMLDQIDSRDGVSAALICDADAAGHFTELGGGMNDLDSYILALVKKGVAQIIICGVHGTRELENSIRFVREKIAAYQA